MLPASPRGRGQQLPLEQETRFRRLQHNIRPQTQGEGRQWVVKEGQYTGGDEQSAVVLALWGAAGRRGARAELFLLYHGPNDQIILNDRTYLGCCNTQSGCRTSQIGVLLGQVGRRTSPTGFGAATHKRCRARPVQVGNRSERSTTFEFPGLVNLGPSNLHNIVGGCVTKGRAHAEQLPAPPATLSLSKSSVGFDASVSTVLSRSRYVSGR